MWLKEGVSKSGNALNGSAWVTWFVGNLLTNIQSLTKILLLISNDCDSKTCTIWIQARYLPPSMNQK